VYSFKLVLAGRTSSDSLKHTITYLFSSPIQVTDHLLSPVQNKVLNLALEVQIIQFK